MKQNANPFKGQHANGCLMTFAEPPQPLVQGFGPGAPFAGMSRKFLKALTQEFRTGPTPMHPALFAALFGDRGNARQLVNLLGGLKAIPIRAKRRQQTRGQSLARPRKTLKQGAIGMLLKNRGDLLIKPLDGLQQRAYLLNQNLGHHRARQHCRRILSQGPGSPDLLQSLLQLFGTRPPMVPIELPDPFWTGLLERFQRRPPFQEIAGLGTVATS